MTCQIAKSAAEPTEAAGRGYRDTCSRIDAALDGLAALVRAELSQTDFYDRLFAEAVGTFGALGGVIWQSDHGELQEVYSYQSGSAPRLALTPERRHAIKRAMETSDNAAQAVTIKIETGAPAEPACWSSIIVPLAINRAGDGALEIVVDGCHDGESANRNGQIGEAMAELANDFHRRRQLNDCLAREAVWQSSLRLLERIQRPTLRTTAVAIVNEGRSFIGCDRVICVARVGRHLRALAATGVERLERRSSVVRGAEVLAAAVLKSDEPLWEIGQRQARAPQVDEALQTYLDAAHARGLVVLVVRNIRIAEGSAGPCAGDADAAITQSSDEETVGAIVLEWFTQPSLDSHDLLRIESLERHAGRALAMALAAEKVPLVHLGRRLARVRLLTKARRLSGVVWGTVIAVIMLLALVFVPVDFRIAAEGELRPVERRVVFAPAQGVVDAIFVEHGDDVTAGHLLLRLRSPGLDLEAARIEGELQTVQKRLAAAVAGRLERTTDSKASAARAWQLTAEEEELRESLKALKQQEQLLADQRAELEIKSPLAGRVLAWDVRQALAGRPVDRGEPLLVVGNVAGEWEAELRVADRQIGYVANANEEALRGGDALSVSFALSAAPGAVYRGELRRVALRSQWDESRDESFVPAIVGVKHRIERTLPGATVVAKIDCGRRSLGFVWLHELGNTLWRWLYF